MNFQPVNETENQPELMERRARSGKRRSGRLRRILLLLAAFLMGLFSYNIFAMVKFLNKANQNEISKIGNTVDVSEWKGEEAVNVLLMGVDNRNKDEVPRSDSMMLVSINPKTKQAALMSIMRDTYVNIPGHGKGKINSAFAYGGPSLAVKTVENFLKVPVHYYVVTDFQGFEGIIDAIGGVQIDVEIPMKHVDDGKYDIDLKKGLQHLNGREALQYVRYRGDPRADFARTERQRKLVKAVIDQLKTPLTLVRFPSMLQEAESYVQTNMTAGDVMRLSTTVFGLDASSFHSVQIPPNDLLTETYDYLGQSILEPDEKGVQQFVKELLENGDRNRPEPATQTGSQGTGGTGTKTGTGTGAGAGAGTGAGTNSDKLTATVTSETGVNVRQGPGTDQPIVTSVVPGTEVTVLAQEGEWYKVELEDGTVGYIFGELLTVNP